MLIIYLHQIITVDVGCATCTEKLTEIQKVVNPFMDLKTDETTTSQQCPTSDDIQNCQNILEGLTEELLHIRNASISVQNVLRLEEHGAISSLYSTRVIPQWRLSIKV